MSPAWGPVWFKIMWPQMSSTSNLCWLPENAPQWEAQPCSGSTLMGFLPCEGSMVLQMGFQAVFSPGLPRLAPQQLSYQLILAIIAQRVTGNTLHQGLHRSSPPASHTYTTLTSVKDSGIGKGSSPWGRVQPANPSLPKLFHSPVCSPPFLIFFFFSSE